MTLADLRSYALRAVIFILVSLFLLLSVGRVVRSEKDREQQAVLSERLEGFLSAARYDPVDLSTFSHHPDVTAFYIAKSEAGKIIGFIMDVRMNDAGTIFCFRMGFSPDGEKITRIRMIDEDGTEPSEPDPNILVLCDQLKDVRIPVALSSQMSIDVLTQNEYPSIPGLIDGVFYAEAEDYDRNGYKDFVEIRVSSGRIISVAWDAIHRDEGEPMRSEASVSGAFSLGDNQPIWAAQAHSIRNKLLEVQDPVRLAIKSDGTTEIVPDVKMDVHMFYDLVVLCIENSKRNITKPLIPTPAPVETEETETLHSSTAGMGASEETDSSSDDTYQTEPEETVLYEPTPSMTPTPTPGGAVIGYEDGVVDSGHNPVLSDSIDGLPVSEIRTQIEGLPDQPQISILMVRSVNTAYKFLREYMKWGT